MTNQNQIKFNKGISSPIGILIVVVLAALAGGILIWQQREIRKEQERVEIPEIKLPEKEVPRKEIKDETTDLSPEASATEDWETYRNEEYGFEMKYPTTFYIKESTPKDIVFEEIKYKGELLHYPWIAIKIFNSKLSLKEWLNKNSTPIESFLLEPEENYIYYGVKDIKESQINNLSVLQFWSSSATEGIRHTLIKDSQNIIDINNITTPLGGISDTIYNQIISTFRFVK